MFDGRSSLAKWLILASIIILMVKKNRRASSNLTNYKWKKYVLNELCICQKQRSHRICMPSSAHRCTRRELRPLNPPFSSDKVSHYLELTPTFKEANNFGVFNSKIILYKHFFENHCSKIRKTILKNLHDFERITRKQFVHRWASQSTCDKIIAKSCFHVVMNHNVKRSTGSDELK